MLQKFKSALALRVRQFLFARSTIVISNASRQELSGVKVLILGVYLADRRNFSAHLIERFTESSVLQVTQKWAALKGQPSSPLVAKYTKVISENLVPKFQLLNQLLSGEDLGQYDFIIISDDDIVVPKGFLEGYIAAQLKVDFALCQPARADHSFFDHRLMLREKAYFARETRFVEIGPVFSMNKRAAALIMPFDEYSPMGYGYDFHWPVVMAKAGLKIGVIDAVSVDHSYRPQASGYSVTNNQSVMAAYLKKHPHLTYEEAMQVVRKINI